GFLPLSLQPPTDCEEQLLVRPLFQLAFDLSDQLGTLLVDLVLGIEQRTSLSRSLALQRFNGLLTCQLFLKRRRDGSSTTGILNLAIQLLQLALKADFQIIGPAV